MKSQIHASKKIAFLFLLALLCGTAQAQGSESLSLIFQSEPGERPLSMPGIIHAEFVARLDDAYGDGTPDLILTTKDDDGNLQGLRVVDVASGTTLWQVQDVPQTLGILTVPIMGGFADIDADGKPEALFAGDQGVVLINPSNNSLVWHFGEHYALLGVTDMTGDGYPELILFLRETRQVQVWSKP